MQFFPEVLFLKNCNKDTYLDLSCVPTSFKSEFWNFCQKICQIKGARILQFYSVWKFVFLPRQEWFLMWWANGSQWIWSCSSKFGSLSMTINLKNKWKSKIGYFLWTLRKKSLLLVAFDTGQDLNSKHEMLWFQSSFCHYGNSSFGQICPSFQIIFD